MSRATCALLAVCVTAILICADRHIHHPVGTTNDDAIYVLLAQSMRHGHYSDLTRPGNPPEVHFLPGYPALLTLVLPFVDAQWDRLRWLSITLVLAGGFMAFVLLQQWLPGPRGFLAFLLFACSPQTAMQADILYSEWWLLVLFMLALFLLARRAPEKRLGDTLALTMCLCWAALARPEGILFPLALGLVAMEQKRLSRLALPVFLPLAAVLSWFVRNHLYGGRMSSYTSEWHLPSLPHVIAVLSGPSQWLLGWPGAHGLSLVFLCLLTVALFGWNVRDALSGDTLWKRVAILAAFFYIAVHGLWPAEDDRFFIPLLPIMAALFIKTLDDWADRVSLPRLWRVVSIGVVLCLFAIHRPVVSADSRPQATLRFIVSQTPPDTLFLTNKDGWLTLYTGYQRAGDPEALNAEDFAYQLQKAGVGRIWILRRPMADRQVEQLWRQADQWMQSWPAVFPVLYSDREENSTVYGLNAGKNYVAAYEAYWSARQLLAHGDRPKAMDALSALAKRTDVVLPGALNDYGALLLEQGDARHAIANVQRALNARPRFMLAWVNLARARARLADKDGAIVALNHAESVSSTPVERQLVEETRNGLWMEDLRKR